MQFSNMSLESPFLSEFLNIQFLNQIPFQCYLHLPSLSFNLDSLFYRHFFYIYIRTNSRLIMCTLHCIKLNKNRFMHRITSYKRKLVKLSLQQPAIEIKLTNNLISLHIDQTHAGKYFSFNQIIRKFVKTEIYFTFVVFLN
ncbi:unnamed protein product [Schistosoma margrebowiei]|uniref:Uncharacterized protein n=1 Tax=Schistosoma margrebowiei TaxID=48269 RepID=A0AA84ZII7_9TREM|nr:unnamed protein product [Schistosoma margrebowiei]